MACHCQIDFKLQCHGKYKHLHSEDAAYLGEMEILGCPKCHLRFAHPMPSAESLLAYYRDVYRRADRPHRMSRRGPKPDERQWSQLRFLERFISMNEVNTVLDIGAGEGLLLQAIRSKHHRIKQYATEWHPRLKMRLKKKCVQIVELDSFDQNVELIVASHSLEHFSSPGTLLEKLHRGLTPNGYLFIEVPHCPTEGDYYLRRPYDGPHLLFFTIKSLKQLLEHHGFLVKHMDTCGPLLDYALINMQNQYDSLNCKHPTKASLLDPLRHLFHRFQKNNSRELHAFNTYGGNRWAIRVLATTRSCKKMVTKRVDTQRVRTYCIV